VTSARASENLSIVFKAVGDYTRAMRRAVEDGARARIEGPYGGFTLRSALSIKQIWVAGGIGVTPFMSMARSLEGTHYEVDLYYATNNRRTSKRSLNTYPIEYRTSACFRLSRKPTALSPLRRSPK
jgi:predicted ferric reductase